MDENKVVEVAKSVYKLDAVDIILAGFAGFGMLSAGYFTIKGVKKVANNKRASKKMEKIETTKTTDVSDEEIVVVD